MCRNNSRVRPFCLLFYLYHSHTLKRAKIKWEENIRKTKWTKPTGISFQCFWRLRAGAAAIAHGILPLVICILRYRKPSIVIRNVKYVRCLHFEGGNCTQHQSTLFVLFCFKMKNLVLPLKRLRFPVGNDIGHYYTFKKTGCSRLLLLFSIYSISSFTLVFQIDGIHKIPGSACLFLCPSRVPTDTYTQPPSPSIYKSRVSLSLTWETDDTRCVH